MRAALRLCLALALGSTVSQAVAEEGHHRWSAGIRGGPSLLTQDAVRDSNIEGQIGPLFNGVIVYNVHEYLSLGFEAEWEQHKLDQAALTLGNASTASLLIRFEGHLERGQPISPYFLFAGGYNLNSFSEEDAYLGECGAVQRHRLWQARLDKDRFFDQVFGAPAIEQPIEA